MKIDVLTIFPEFFGQAFDFGIIRRAKLAGIVEINVHDIREYAVDKHKMVDDRPFGGGDGMVLKPEPIFAAIENLIGTSDRDAYPEGTRVVCCRLRAGNSSKLWQRSLPMPRSTS